MDKNHQDHSDSTSEDPNLRFLYILQIATLDSPDTYFQQNFADFFDLETTGESSLSSISDKTLNCIYDKKLHPIVIKPESNIDINSEYIPLLSLANTLNESLTEILQETTSSHKSEINRITTNIPSQHCSPSPYITSLEYLPQLNPGNYNQAIRQVSDYKLKGTTQLEKIIVRSKQESEEKRIERRQIVYKILEAEKDITNIHFDIYKGESKIEEIQSQQFETYNFNRELHLILEAQISVIKEQIIKQNQKIASHKLLIRYDNKNKYHTTQRLQVLTQRIRNIQGILKKRIR